MKKSIAFLLILITALSGFERFFGGDSLDYGNWIIEDSERNLVATGTTFLSASSQFDFYLVKMNFNGDSLWTRTYGGGNIDEATGVVEASDGGYVMVGSSNSFNADEQFDIYIVNADTNGATGWVKLYGSANDDYAGAIIRTRDNGYAITGKYNYYPDYILDYYVGDVYLIKTDAAGDTSWTRSYGGSDDDAGQHLAQTHDGGFIITGYTYSFGPGIVDTSNVYLVKTDLFGAIQWQKGIDGNHTYDFGFWVCQREDGGYTILGDSYSQLRRWDAAIFITDSLGNLISWRTFGDTANDICYSGTRTHNKNYILVGQTSSFAANWIDLYVVKTDSLGNLIWQKKFGGNGIDRAYSVVETSDGNYLITGLFGGDTLRSVGDMYVLKLDTAGIVLELTEFNTMKPVKMYLEAYPNPFNSTLHLKFPPGAEIEIYNITGNKIENLTTERIWTPPDHTPAGIYFIKGKLGKEEVVKKVLYIK